MLVDNSYIRIVTEKSLRHEKHLLSIIEQDWYANLLAEGHSISALKTKELAQALIAKKTETDATYHTIQMNIITLENELLELNNDKEILETVLKKLEKSTDWLVQYINWIKFEIRDLAK
jgi:hypothetical protein